MGLTAAEVSLERAKENLRNTKIRAPFGGEAASLSVQKWQTTSPGEECLRLVDRSKIRVKTNVLESEIGYLKPGNRAKILISSYADKVFNGRIESINPIIDEETKTGEVNVSINNPHGDLKPGMFAKVILDAITYKERLLVHRDAIVMRNERKVIFIIRDGIANWSYVKTGYENEDHVEIEWCDSDLAPGELVATGGHFTLSHDTKVKVSEKVN